MSWTRQRIVLLCMFAVLVILCVAGTWIFFHVGDWLVVQDPLAPAKTIVVLSGDMPDRAIEAARDLSAECGSSGVDLPGTESHRGVEADAH